MFKFLLLSVLVAACSASIATLDRQEEDSLAKHVAETNDIFSYNKGVKLDLCMECKFAVEELAAYLNNEDNVKEIEQLFKTYVCANAGPLQAECNELAENIEALVHLVLPMMQNPEQLCQEASLCNAGMTSRAKLVRALGLAYVRKISAVNGEQCELCQLAVQEIASQIQDNEANIITMLKQTCNYCPSKDDCEKFWDNDGKQYIDDLINMLKDAKQACSMIGLCTSNTEMVHTMIRTKLNNFMADHFAADSRLATLKFVLERLQSKMGVSGGCIACEVSFDTVLNILRYSNDSQYGMVNLIKEICTAFPDEIAEQCDDFIDTYGYTVVVFTLKSLTGKTLCQDVGACSKGDMLAVKKSMELNLSPKCEVCYAAVEFLDLELKNKDVQAEIARVLSKVCKLMRKEEDQCDSAVAEIIKMVTDNAEKYLNPSDTCAELLLCDATVGADNSGADGILVHGEPVNID